MSVLHWQHIDDQVVSRVAEAFGLGRVNTVAYLTTGLMNRNWCITTASGTFALKQIVDVPIAVARRNLRIAGALAQVGLPACAPVFTIDRDPVFELGEHGYCVLPWHDGDHMQGPDLTVSQAHHLGAMVGNIHDRLNSLAPSIGLSPATSRCARPVTPPHVAIEDTHRYRGAARAAGGPFDHAVIDLLDRRVALIQTYAADRPTTEDAVGPCGWTHGDLQYRNIIWRYGQIGAVIDWDRIRIRPFAEEIVRTATIQFATPDGLDLHRVTAFVTGYRTAVPIDNAALADGVHRLWWTRVSNFWHLVYHYDRDDHGCDDLLLSGEALLHWWTAHRSDVCDAFTATS